MALIPLISYTFVIIYFIIVIKYNVKKCDTFLEKTLLLTIGSIIIILPYFIYVTDYFNIPSLLIKLGIIKNLNIEFWKDFTTSYIATIAGTILSGGIVFFITKIQLDRTKDDNQESLNEEKRLSNLPYMQYKFKNIETSPEKTTTINVSLNEKSNNNTDEIKLTIKNIGMNTAKKCKIELKGEEIANSNIRAIDYQSFLPQNEEIQIIFKIKNCIEKNYKYKIIFYYQDLLSNQYTQTIYLKYDLNFNINKKTSHENLKIQIDDEQLVIN